MHNVRCDICGTIFRQEASGQLMCGSCYKKLLNSIKHPTLGICPVCGKKYKSKGTQKYCSERCVSIGIRVRQRFFHSGEVAFNKMKKERKIMKPHTSNLDDLCREARDAGLSYGMYTALLREGMVQRATDK